MATLESGGKRRHNLAVKRYRGVCACGHHAWAICTLGYVTFVSPEDAALLTAQAWHANIGTYKGRFRSVYARSGNPPIMFRLHRLIMPGVEVDHIDRHGLHNWRGNLRPATTSQQSANREHPTSIVLFRGVTKFKNGYRARISGQHLGLFATAEAAARAWDAAALQRYGEFALLNFPKPWRSSP